MSEITTRLFLRRWYIIVLLFFVLSPSVNCLANNYIVSSLSSFKEAHNAAEAGDTIIWEPGLYYDININVSKDQLHIMAEIPGKTVFTAYSKIYISGDDNTFSGFQYLKGNIGSGGVVVELRGSRNHLSQLNIKDYYCAKYVVISAGCSNNVLSYCNLENKTYNGDKNILSILVEDKAPGYHTIRYCSFKNFPGTGGDMGVEPIRIGLSTQGEFISRSIVEYCYFTQCNGDGEIISNKARQNVFRYNTFYDNPKGELVLRHGDEGVVYGNFFIKGMGGVRIKEGQHHVLFNNYFSGLTSKAIRLQNYDVDPLDSITIAYNTILDCANLDLGRSGSYPPQNVCFANNIFADPTGNLFTNATGSEKWIGNITHGSLGITKPDSGIREADPGLELNSEGYYGLSAGSTSIDSAQAGYPLLPNYPGMGLDSAVSYDLMQQWRPAEISMKDIGCSEFPQDVMIKPYATESNTGPDYLHEANYLILQIAPHGEGSVLIDPPLGVYDSGAVVTLTAVPDSGYIFSEWSGDLSGDENPLNLVIVEDIASLANFIPSNVNIDEELAPLSAGNIYAVKLFPNPAEDLINVAFNTAKMCIIGLSIFDINGKVLSRIEKDLQETGKQLHEIDISEFPAGIFTMRITISNFNSEKLDIPVDQLTRTFLKH